MVCFGLSRTFTGLVLRCAFSVHTGSRSYTYWSSPQPLYHRCSQRQHRCYEEHAGGTDRLYEHGSGLRLAAHGLVTGHDTWVNMMARLLSCTLELTLRSPVIGGTLARPQDNFPQFFSSPFWGQFPYFLPCGVAAGFSLLTFGAVLLFLKEVGGLRMLIP